MFLRPFDVFLEKLALALQAGGRRFDPGWLHCFKLLVPNNLKPVLFARNFAVFDAFFVLGRKMKNRLPKICRRADRNLAYVTLRGRKIYLGKYGSPESYAEHERVIAEYLTGPVVKPAPIASFANLPPLSSPALAIITSKTACRPSRSNVFAPRSRPFSSRRSIGAAFATSASFGSERFSATEKTPVAIVARISTRSFNAFAPRLSAALPTVTSPQPFWLDSKSRRRSNGDVRPLAKRRRRSRSLRSPAPRRFLFSPRDAARDRAFERRRNAKAPYPVAAQTRRRVENDVLSFFFFDAAELNRFPGLVS